MKKVHHTKNTSYGKEWIIQWEKTVPILAVNTNLVYHQRYHKMGRGFFVIMAKILIGKLKKSTLNFFIILFTELLM